MRRLILISLVLLFIVGCMTMEKAEKMVGECNKETIYKEAPPRTEWIIGEEIQVPPDPSLKIFSWTVDQIRFNPVGYLEVLYTDFTYLYEFAFRIIDYLEELSLARERAIEKAQQE